MPEDTSKFTPQFTAAHRQRLSEAAQARWARARAQKAGAAPMGATMPETEGPATIEAEIEEKVETEADRKAAEEERQLREWEEKEAEKEEKLYDGLFNRYGA